MGTKQKVEPRLMLHGRILYRNHQGVVRDATREKLFGLKYMAEQGELAMLILKQCMKRLEVLALATESRAHVDASLVHLAVKDVRSDLDDAGELVSYVALTQELFTHSTALPQTATNTQDAPGQPDASARVRTKGR